MCLVSVLTEVAPPLHVHSQVIQHAASPSYAQPNRPHPGSSHAFTRSRLPPVLQPSTHGVHSSALKLRAQVSSSSLTLWSPWSAVQAESAWTAGTSVVCLYSNARRWMNSSSTRETVAYWLADASARLHCTARHLRGRVCACLTSDTTVLLLKLRCVCAQNELSSRAR